MRHSDRGGETGPGPDIGPRRLMGLLRAGRAGAGAGGEEVVAGD